MIEYDFGKWGIGFIWQIEGSVFPQALMIAVPNACLTVALNWLIHSSGYMTLSEDSVDLKGALVIWGGYTGVLGFLLVFRTQIAYSRFWEGGTTLQQVRGVWFNATSNLVAFCSDAEDMRFKVEKFQHLLVRLMSMMYCAALQQVADMHDEHFEILQHNGISEESLKYLAHAEDRCEVIMQWIQRLIVINMNTNVVRIAPPIASRVFQELSNGIVDVQNARKIAEFKFPFPYAQMLTVSLMLHWLMTPPLAAVIIHPDQKIIGSMIVLVTVLALWCINFIAAEVENPFGDDPNDLPVESMQLHFNRSLRTLMDPLVQTPPDFNYQRELHARLQAGPSRLRFFSTTRMKMSRNNG
jgi:putative membrane protein